MSQTMFLWCWNCAQGLWQKPKELFAITRPSLTYKPEKQSQGGRLSNRPLLAEARRMQKLLDTDS